MLLDQRRTRKLSSQKQKKRIQKWTCRYLQVQEGKDMLRKSKKFTSKAFIPPDVSLGNKEQLQHHNYQQIPPLFGLK